MPTPTSYTKSIATDFPNGKVNTSNLKTEIEDSEISISLSHINTEDDVCEIWFRDVLSTQDFDLLNTIIANHTGEDFTNPVQIVQIMEETTGTGGYFCTRSINISAAAGATTTLDVFWPHPISALAMKFFTDDTASTDVVNMTVGANTTVGTLSANSGNSAPSWSSGNYVVGNKVMYTLSSTHGSRVYTCILNTTSNQPPSDKTYWRLGYELSVSSTVIKTSNIGYYMTLTDGTTTQDVGRILYKTASTIFVETVPSKNFLASTPTSVKQTVYVLKDHYITNGKVFSIGEGKIGGSFVPADTIITIKYTNNATLITKKLTGFLEFLY